MASGPDVAVTTTGQPTGDMPPIVSSADMIAEDVSLVDASQTEPAQEHKAGANREFTITVKDGTDDEFHWALAESQGRRPGMGFR
ncbi:hypothetical protein HaLaN_15263 [Haematococcus lacustris]|uniref:Uncharacterized protein n=1 Tax=Haematococcus lacustris TaxID=44745 RepID=A0A699Z766_HAELA|nr:hypothetical protein HaLaN_15263 [Haematococcus lacustris]